MAHENHLIELFVGYSQLDKINREMKANCSVTLIKGEKTIILFDTLTGWDSDTLIQELKYHHVNPEDINYVVCSHGHSDHVGNLNLFLHAQQHFVGSSINHKNVYILHDFDESPFVLDKDIEVISTPGHTNSCISLIVRNTNYENSGSVAIVGDLFEREEDIFDDSLWIDAGTENEIVQRKNRLKVAEMVDFIIPGHGPRFKVTEEMREKLRHDAKRC